LAVATSGISLNMAEMLRLEGSFFGLVHRNCCLSNKECGRCGKTLAAAQVRCTRSRGRRLLAVKKIAGNRQLTDYHLPPDTVEPRLGQLRVAAQAGERHVEHGFIFATHVHTSSANMTPAPSRSPTSRSSTPDKSCSDTSPMVTVDFFPPSKTRRLRTLR